jgi:hypothetical protein
VATQADVRRIALSLEGTTEDPSEFVFRVNDKFFVWLWRERVDPRRARVPNPEVIAVRVADDIAKQMLLAMDPKVFFTEPHYDGYNAVLVRLPKISLPMLKDVVAQAWATRSGAATRSGSPVRRPRPASRARPSRPVRGHRA